MVTMKSADNRKESRGAHARDDYKERNDDDWLFHTLAWFKDNDIKIELSGRRFGAEGYGPSIYCRDPDGNLVELKGPSELLSHGN